MSKLTTEFTRNGKVLLRSQAELSVMHSRYLGTIGKVQVFDHVRFRDAQDRRRGQDYSAVEMAGSFSVVQRDENGTIVQLFAVSKPEVLARIPGVELRNF